MDHHTPIAWVESPLQLIGAAEWADAHGRTVPVAGRLTPQMSQTADELVARGAPFGRLEPYLGIPFALLREHRHWLVGDGFSGQFRLAATILRPRRVTFLDDGANTVALADALRGDRPYARPGVDEKRMTRTFAPFAAMAVLERARTGHADFFTAFPLGATRTECLRDRGFGVESHDFPWTRRTQRAPHDLGERVVLGSARPVDGRMTLDGYLEWLADVTAGRPATYLPHRRETPAQLAAVARLAHLEIRHPQLPVELVLAGARGPLDVLTLPSSTTTTLALALGDGARINGRRVQTRQSTSIREASA